GDPRPDRKPGARRGRGGLPAHRGWRAPGTVVPAALPRWAVSRRPARAAPPRSRPPPRSPRETAPAATVRPPPRRGPPAAPDPGTATARRRTSAPRPARRAGRSEPVRRTPVPADCPARPPPPP